MAKKSTNQQAPIAEPAIPIAGSAELNPETIENMEPHPMAAPTPLEILSQPPLNGIPEAGVQSKVDRVFEMLKERREYQKEDPLSTEEKVVGFLKARNTGSFIPINDFLKSLYHQGLPNSRKAWHDQRTMKLLRNTLEEMVKSRQVIIEGNIHQRLSKFFYPDSSTGVTHYYNLDTLQLRAKLP